TRRRDGGRSPCGLQPRGHVREVGGRRPPHGGPRMVAHLLSLKWRLLLNGFRRSPAQLIGLILGSLYALCVVMLLMVVLVVLRWAPAETANTVVVLGGAAAM